MSTWCEKQYTFFIIPNITAVLDKIQEYRRNWLRHIKGMPRNRLPRIIKPTEQEAGKNWAGH